jgi:hypothetical protein
MAQITMGADMALQAIGAGFGRTGTHSLKIALETLGLAPCYHMVEVFAHLEHAEVWDGLGKGTRDDFDTALAGYPATVDWPSTFFWLELADRNPAAKIILTERPAEEWYQSFSQTILAAMLRAKANALAGIAPAPEMRAAGPMMRTVIVDGTFGGDLSKENCIATYQRHNQAVRDTISKDRLLIFNARDGWAPLCGFLGIPVPAAPYPKTNSTDEFRERANL